MKKQMKNILIRKILILIILIFLVIFCIIKVKGKTTEVAEQIEEPKITIKTENHIKNVPYLNQKELGYPTGCEAVSATMLLQYKGYDVSKASLW